MLYALAPHCPDCGQICGHPLQMAVKCPGCAGVGSSDVVLGTIVYPCALCGGGGTVSPPPPTDEQIFGRECSACHGTGNEYDVEFYPAGRSCGDCSGTGRIGAAENRWKCYGHHADERTAKGYCPGRDDIEAPPELWAEIKRSWRQRTRTTVFSEHVVGQSERGERKYCLTCVIGRWLAVRGMLPAGALVHDAVPGKLTIRVDFEPDEIVDGDVSTERKRT